MTTHIVRPTAVITQVGTFKNQAGSSGTANILAAINDNSDTTYATSRDTGSTIRRWELLLGAPSIASDEYVARVGHVIRWKYNGSTKPIGVIAYRGIDSVPTGIPTLTPSSSVTTFTTNEIAYSPVAWTVAQCADLRMSWYDSASPTTTSGTQHAEVLANIYTIKRATATPQAATVTVSTPTVTVAVAHTIDWESSTLDWQNLRKIRVEMQIESGGSGINTGTVMTNVSQDFNATTTGTSNRILSAGVALPNGTYNVYARAIRFREDGSSAADTTSAWSSAATLTVNAPVPNTPTISLSADQTLDRVAVTVTPVTTSGYTLPKILLQRSDDGGTSWTDVRFAKNVAATFGVASVFYDYEAPRGVTVRYRAQVSGTYTGGSINASAWTSALTATLTADTWNLKAPTLPVLNVTGAIVVGAPSESPYEDQGVFRPLERQYPVVISGTLGGWDGDLSLLCTSAAEWEAVRDLITSQTTLLLESPFGWSKYIRLLAGSRSTVLGTATVQRRAVALNYVEVGKPTIVDGATA